MKSCLPLPTTTSTSSWKMPPPSRHCHCSRSPITILLLILGSLAIVYQLFASFPSLGVSLYESLAVGSAPGNSCTKDIGDGRCCILFLKAEPCVEECRREYVDRETFALTEGFDACADRCLLRYKESCDMKEGLRVEGLGAS